MGTYMVETRTESETLDIIGACSPRCVGELESLGVCIDELGSTAMPGSVTRAIWSWLAVSRPECTICYGESPCSGDSTCASDSCCSTCPQGQGR